MAQSETVLVPSPAGARRLRLPLRLAAAALLALATAGLFFLGTGTPEAPTPSAAAPSQAATLVAAAARQLQAEGVVRVDATTARLGVSAEGSRLVYGMQLSIEAGAADMAAIRARDAAALCTAVDPSRLIALGATIEHRYADASGNRFSSAVASCPGGGAAATAAMPVAL